MMYFRQILVPLVLLLAAGGRLSAQTDIPWTRVYESPQKNMGVTAVALDPDGGIYVGRLGAGAEYAPPSSGPELDWRPLDREHIPFTNVHPRFPHITPVSIVASPAGSDAVYMLANIAGSGRQMYSYSRSERRWVLDSADLRYTGMRKLVMDRRETIFAISDTGGLFRRTPGERGWGSLGNPSLRVRDLIVGDSNVLLAGIDGGGILRSGDGGDSWTELDVPSDPAWRNAPMFGSGPDGAVYALWRDLWRSRDNGKTWTLIPNRPPNACSGIAGGSQGEIYFLCANDRPGGGGLFVTHDDGATWTEPVPGLKNNATGGIATGTIAAGGQVYVGAGSRVIRLADGGRTWDDVYAPAVSRVDAFNGVIAAVDQGRLWKLLAEENVWKPEARTDISALRIEGSRGILIGVDGTLIRMPFFLVGTTTVLAVPGSTAILDIEVDSRGWIYVLFLTAEGERRVSVSRDEGASWEERNRIPMQPFRGTVIAIAIDREDNLYAAVNERQILRIAAGETYWSLVASVEGRSPITGIAMHPSGNPVVIGSDWIGYCSPAASRVDVQAVTGTELSDIAFAPGGYGVVAGSGGVLLSEDGRAWKPSNLWLDSAGPASASGEGHALCVAIDERGVCYVGTRGRGIWSGPVGSISSVGGGRDAASAHVRSSLALSPNPAAGHLSVRYTLAEGGDATVVLHDLLGHPVLAVPAGDLPPGEGVMHLDLRGVPAGTYIAAVKTGGVIRASAPVTVIGR